MRYTSNPERGCGEKHDGYYLIGEPSVAGSLAAVTMCAGTHTAESDQNLRFDLPPLLTHWIDPERTIDTCTLHYMEASLADRQDGAYTRSSRDQIHALGVYAVAHHVGREYYTPVIHLVETATYGPSLRVDQRIAQGLAPYLPMRIFFQFNDLPWFETSDHFQSFLDQVVYQEALDRDAQRIAQILRIPRLHDTDGMQYTREDIDNAPNWTFREWGGRVTDDNGTWHAILPTLSYLERTGDWPRDVQRGPGLLYYSWITASIKAVSGATAGVDASDEGVVASLNPQDYLDDSDRQAGVQARMIAPLGE